MSIEPLSPERERQLSLNLVLDEEEQEGVLRNEDAAVISEMARKRFEANTGEYAGWAMEYSRLRESGWPWRVAAYIAWASAPRKERTPKTQLELAQKCLGLRSDRVIQLWRKKNPAIDEMVGLSQAAVLWDHRRDVFEALIRSATQGDYRSHPDRKLALEMLGDYTPKAKLDLTERRDASDLSSFSDEELDKLARYALPKEAAKRALELNQDGEDDASEAA